MASHIYNQKMTKTRADRHLRVFGFAINCVDDGHVSVSDETYREMVKEYDYIKDTLCNAQPCAPQRRKSFGVTYNDPSQRQSELERKSAQQGNYDRN